jgi:hypothetical protein
MGPKIRLPESVSVPRDVLPVSLKELHTGCADQANAEIFPSFSPFASRIHHKLVATTISV